MLVIMDHLDDFVQILLSVIANESEAGLKNVLAILDRAERRYQEPVESLVKGWFYQYTRIKGEKIHQSQFVIKHFPDAYTRLQEFKLLLEEKHWGAFNFCFFDELVKSIPGYEPLADDEQRPVLKRIKGLMLEKIDAFMVEYKASQAHAARRKQEQIDMEQQALLQINKELLWSTLDAAQTSLAQKPDSIHFCLSLNDKLWQLHWIDFTGKPHRLELTEELYKLLVTHKIANVENISAIEAKSIKKECMAARGLFFSKAAQTLINPTTTNEQLTAAGTNTAFVLRGAQAPYALFWINVVGSVNEINLAGYPELSSWLNEQTTFGATEMERLKTYLLYVNTSKALGREDFQAKLADCLSGTRPQAQAKDNNTSRLDMTAFSKIEELFADDEFKARKKVENQALPGRLDLERFNAVAQIFASDEEKSREKIEGREEPGSLNLTQFSAVATLFAHRPKVAPESEAARAALPLQ